MQTALLVAGPDAGTSADIRRFQELCRDYGELERLVGKKAMEVEILQAARDEVKKTRTAKLAGVRARSLRRSV